MKPKETGIDPQAKASGTGCVESEAVGGWWLHLRRCAECGHIGCCESSPSQHALRPKHYVITGHPIITSFEPGEEWFYDYRTEEFFEARSEAPGAHPHPRGSTDTRTGRSGTCKLANAASQKRRESTGDLFTDLRSRVLESFVAICPRIWEGDSAMMGIDDAVVLVARLFSRAAVSDLRLQEAKGLFGHG